jgi:hypothetical protein
VQQQHGRDLVGVGLEGQPRRYQPDEGVDQVAGHDRRHRGQGAEHLDVGRLEPDLLLGLAQRGGLQVLAGLRAAARKRDLPGVPAQVLAALGEHQPGALRQPEQRRQDRGVDAAAGGHGPCLVGRQQGCP